MSGKSIGIEWKTTWFKSSFRSSNRKRTSLCLPSLRKFLVRGAQYRQRGKINARMFIASYLRFDRKVLFKPEIISTILRRKVDTDESTARPACTDYRLLERQNLNSHCTTACYTRYIQGRISLISYYILFIFQFK